MEHWADIIRRQVAYQRFRKRATERYRWLYYGPLRCTNLLRLPRYLPRVPAPPPVVGESCRLIYYFIPKTGCTTVKSLILQAESRPVPDDNEELHRRTEELFVAPAVLESQQQRYAGCFRFAFVRNPWARLVSGYLNKVVAPRPGRFGDFRYLYPHVRFERMSFADFVRFIRHVPDELCEPHFKPQAAFFDDDQVDFVGRFERFAEDLAQVIERAGLDQRLRKWCHTKRMTSKPDKPYTDYYTAKTRRLVAEKYKDDVERFGYKFGG